MPLTGYIGLARAEALCTLTSMEPTEVGENSCRVHVGVIAYIILFIAVLPFSWGPG